MQVVDAYRFFGLHRVNLHRKYDHPEMPRWRESDDLRRLLGAFERVLPLRKPSDLMQRPIAQFILVASGGLTVSAASRPSGEITRA